MVPAGASGGNAVGFEKVAQNSPVNSALGVLQTCIPIWTLFSTILSISIPMERMVL